MVKTAHYHTKFISGKFYHIYNRTVDKQPMFRGNGNYEFFLKKYHEYLSPFIDTYAYCLLGNHFHLLISVRSAADLTTFEKLSNLNTHDLISRQFRKFFQSYAMAFNKQNNRIGTLFQTPFKRVCIDNTNHFANLVFYIHANPQLHGLVPDFRDWPWSSYNSMLSNKPSALKREEVLNWFENKENYRNFHVGNIPDFSTIEMVDN